MWQKLLQLLIAFNNIMDGAAKDRLWLIILLFIKMVRTQSVTQTSKSSWRHSATAKLCRLEPLQYLWTSATQSGCCDNLTARPVLNDSRRPGCSGLFWAIMSLWCRTTSGCTSWCRCCPSFCKRSFPNCCCCGTFTIVPGSCSLCFTFSPAYECGRCWFSETFSSSSCCCCCCCGCGCQLIASMSCFLLSAASPCFASDSATLSCICNRKKYSYYYYYYVSKQFYIRSNQQLCDQDLGCKCQSLRARCTNHT